MLPIEGQTWPWKAQLESPIHCLGLSVLLLDSSAVKMAKLPHCPPELLSSMPIPHPHTEEVSAICLCIPLERRVESPLELCIRLGAGNGTETRPVSDLRKFIAW